MNGLDAAWVTLGIFLLACGALPALLAMREERRRPRGTRLFHESAEGLPPLAWAGTAQVQHPGWTPAWAGAAFAIPPAHAARRKSARPAHPPAPDTSAG